MNQADTAWMLISTALVLLMTPALAFFYGGFSTVQERPQHHDMSFIALGFVGVLWAVIGAPLAFAPQQVRRRPVPSLPACRRPRAAQGTIPHLLFMCYQGTFAIITAA
jgi:Amt family ammonium transporter